MCGGGQRGEEGRDGCGWVKSDERESDGHEGSWLWIGLG